MIGNRKRSLINAKFTSYSVIELFDFWDNYVQKDKLNLIVSTSS